VPASQALLEGERLAYLKSHQPIGGRDLATVSLLRQHHIDSYFSGCVTLTLGTGHKYAPDDYVCAVDLDDELHHCLADRVHSPIRRLTHHIAGGTFAERCAKAGDLLSIYAKAKCVVTTRLHCALPCLALGTPILLIGPPDYYRFSGLADLLRHCTAESFKSGNVDFDFDNPGANPDAHLKLRQSLITSLQTFTGTARRPFCPAAATEPHVFGQQKML
jgi:hypothetical protein